jgi:hypothetical protein
MAAVKLINIWNQKTYMLLFLASAFTNRKKKVLHTTKNRIVIPANPALFYLTKA